MRLAFIIIYIFFVSATGQSAQSAFAAGILSDDINSQYGWDNPELVNDDYRNNQQNAIDSHSVTANGDLFIDIFFKTQPKTALLADENGNTKQPDYFDDKRTRLAGTGSGAMFARADISNIDSGRDGQLAKNPSPRHSYYEKVVFWIRDTYQAWVAKDRYGSARLVLLSFGLIGLIGIRRKFKKN